jgi:hypothetical protein
MSHDERNKRTYSYKFSNGEAHYMTPIEAHKYAHRKKIDITHGPNYIEGKKEKSFDGWGWHDGLLRSFKGPKDYRDYLKANGMVEAGIGDRPTEWKNNKPIWTEDLIRKANSYGMDIGGVLAEALLKGELDYPDGSMAEDI